MGTLIALIVFSFLIFFHELGHFLAARYFGVHVEVFSIGFGKRILTKRIGATDWSFSLIPLGGYVRMKGQSDDDPRKKSYDEDSYNSKTPMQKIIISLAGPLANFLLAFLLYFAVSTIGVPTPLSHIGNVMKESPAAQSGIEKNDIITNIDGQPIKFWSQIGEKIGQNSSTHQVSILRDNKEISLSISPKLMKTKNNFGELKQRYLLGIGPKGGAYESVPYGLDKGVDFAYTQTKQASLYIINSLKKLISGLIPMENLGGVIGIVDTTSKVSHMGIVALLMFAALISVNLGVVNLLPIPALDGGHIMFHLYELITGKPANEEIMFKLTLFGWAILLSLMLLGFYNDINRFFG
jgi:regulator of sigma E protease